MSTYYVSGKRSKLMENVGILNHGIYNIQTIAQRRLLFKRHYHIDFEIAIKDWTVMYIGFIFFNYFIIIYKCIHIHTYIYINTTTTITHIHLFNLTHEQMIHCMYKLRILVMCVYIHSLHLKQKHKPTFIQILIQMWNNHICNTHTQKRMLNANNIWLFVHFIKQQQNQQTSARTNCEMPNKKYRTKQGGGPRSAIQIVNYIQNGIMIIISSIINSCQGFRQFHKVIRALLCAVCFKFPYICIVIFIT